MFKKYKQKIYNQGYVDACKKVTEIMPDLITEELVKRGLHLEDREVFAKYRTADEYYQALSKEQFVDILFTYPDEVEFNVGMLKHLYEHNKLLIVGELIAAGGLEAD